MRYSIRTALVTIVGLLCWSTAQATPQFANVNLNPAASEAGFNSETICDGPGFPSCDNDLLGPSSYTVTFANPGLFSASITQSITGTGGSFSTLDFDVTDPSATNVESGVTSFTNLAVIAGVYTVTVNWEFSGGPNSNSAAWSMPLTTGPEILRIPEPMTLALIGIGMAGLGFVRRRKSS